MSKKENTTEAPQQEEKIVTRYDRRMQKRKEQEEKRRKERKITAAIGIVILAAVAALIISFPIRSYISVHETYVEIGGEKVSRVEFDYYYNSAYNTYYSNYGAMMANWGIDLTGDLTNMLYSETMTWDDFFRQMAAENIRTNKALVRAARAEGFEYDSDETYAQFTESVKTQAASQGMSTKNLIKNLYGSYATLDRIEQYLKEGYYANAYYTQLNGRFVPTDEEINTYYEEHKDSYDSLDYRAIEIDAELPEAPTELADPQPETDASEEGAEAGDENAEEEAYEPSEAEIAAAMEEAHEKAVLAEKTITEDAELVEGADFSTLNFAYDDWLLDEERKAGDTTIIEDNDGNRYFVVEFVKRYRDDSPTMKARVITTYTQEAMDTVKSEWEKGPATEEKFIELYNTYSEDGDLVEDGLYDGLMYDSMLEINEDMGEWLFAEERKTGDVFDVALEDGSGFFFVYFLEASQPEWYHSIRNTLSENAMNDYIDSLVEEIEIVDKKGHLRYLTMGDALAGGTESTEAERTESPEDTAAGDETENAGTEDAGSEGSTAAGE